MAAYDEQRKLHAQLEELDRRYAQEDGRQSNADMAEVMATAAGRRIIAMICARGRVFAQLGREPVRDNNALALAYDAGRRDLACEIYCKANAVCPERVLEMFNERNAMEIDRRERREQIYREMQKLQERNREQ